MSSPNRTGTRVARFLKLAVHCGLACLLLSCRTADNKELDRPHAHAVGPLRGPNILLIIADDHPQDTLGIDGDRHQATPCLDRLAKQGVWFDRAFCNAPLCTASRQSLITGRLPHATGVTRLSTPLSDLEVTMGDWFSDLGYVTGAHGKMHFNREGAKHGFNDRLDEPEYERWLAANPPQGGYHKKSWRPLIDPARDWLNAANEPIDLPARWMDSEFYVDRAGEFIERHKSDGKPFLLVVGLYDPHAPFKFPKDWDHRYRPEEFEVPRPSREDLAEQPSVFRDLKPSEIQGIQAAYYTAISFEDHEVGRLIDKLDAAGISENTIVIYVGDNGYLRGEHGRFEKHCLYEQAVRVPLIFRWKGHLPEGRRVHDLVEFVDIFPTVLEITGQSPPPRLHGRSLLSLAKGETFAKGREFAFSEYLETEEAMIRSERFKLIVGTGRRERTDGYTTGKPLPGPYEKLYDLESDPGETRNLIGRPELGETRNLLEQRLLERLASTRNAGDQVPPGLARMDAIHWCLRPRD